MRLFINRKRERGEGGKKIHRLMINYSEHLHQSRWVRSVSHHFDTRLRENFSRELGVLLLELKKKKRIPFREKKIDDAVQFAKLSLDRSSCTPSACPRGNAKRRRRRRLEEPGARKLKKKLVGEAVGEEKRKQARAHARTHVSRTKRNVSTLEFGEKERGLVTSASVSSSSSS